MLKDITNLEQVIDRLSEVVITKQQGLDDTLFALQAWLDRHIVTLTEADRRRFSATLHAEKDPSTRDGKTYGDDTTLILSVLRMHAMRLIYRYDEKQRSNGGAKDNSPYERAKYQLQISLRQVEMALNEARFDTVIANAHAILNDQAANRRWLHEALLRLQSVRNKNLLKMAESLPLPDLPKLNIFQKFGFFILRIDPNEIAQRSVASLQHIARLQTEQFQEMANLLSESFDAIHDDNGTEAAKGLLQAS